MDGRDIDRFVPSVRRSVACRWNARARATRAPSFFRSVVRLFIRSLTNSQPTGGLPFHLFVCRSVSHFRSDRCVPRSFVAWSRPAARTAATHALNVCISLLDPLPPPPEQPPGHPLAQSPEPSAAEGAALEAQAQLRRLAVQCVAQSVDRLVAQLGEAAGGAAREREASYGLLRPPVGQTRLKAAELLAVLLRTEDPAAGAWVG